VPSAKPDSVGSTSDYPALRAGLSHAAATRLEIRFVPPPADNTEFRNRRLRAGLHSFAALRLGETREQKERSPAFSIDVQATEKWGTSRLSQDRRA